MIDRWGNAIRIGWPAHHVIWIEAAMTLPFGKRTAAYQEIADMAGRSLHSVEHKAKWIRSERVRLDTVWAKRERLKALAAMPEFSTEARG